MIHLWWLGACSGADPTGGACDFVPEIVGNGIDDDCDGFGDEFGEHGRLVSEGRVALAGAEGTYIGTSLATGQDARGIPWLVVGSGSAWVYAAPQPSGQVLEVIGPLDDYATGFGDAVEVGSFDGPLDVPVVISNPDDSFVGLFGPTGTRVVVPFTEETRFGLLGSALQTGDVDGDGFDELVVSAPDALYGVDVTGDLLVLDGPVTPAEWANERLHVYFEYPPAQNAGQRLGDVVDLTGDGIPEITLSSDEDGGRIWMIPGDTTGTGFLPDLQVASLAGESPDHSAGALGCVAGDADDDGHQDLLVAGGPEGHPLLLLGPFEGQRSLDGAEATFEGVGCPYAMTFLLADGEDHPVITCRNGLGRVQVFQGGRATGTLGLEQADLVFFGAEAEDYVGSDIGGRDDLSGDGIPDLVITAPGDSTFAPGGGVVYVFDGPLL